VAAEGSGERACGGDRVGDETGLGVELEKTRWRTEGSPFHHQLLQQQRHPSVFQSQKLGRWELSVRRTQLQSVSEDENIINISFKQQEAAEGSPCNSEHL
jgi:hypothetical protein